MCLRNLKKIAESERWKSIETMWIVWSWNGIDVIASLYLFPNLKKVYVTDIRDSIFDLIKENVANNIKTDVELVYVSWRDCDPISEPVDLIYANLPLIMVDSSKIEDGIETTTLTDMTAYIKMSQWVDDELLKRSLLSQLWLLQWAKKKLKEDWKILTLIGGRIPYRAIDECFKRAWFSYELMNIWFMNQSDPEFMENYAEWENKWNSEFCFYNYLQADKILSEKWVTIPDMIPDISIDTLQVLLKPAQINANEAYQEYKRWNKVWHISFGFLAKADDTK